MGLNGGACPKFKCAHFLSGAEVFLRIMEDGRARLSTPNLEKLGLYLDIDIASDLKQIFKTSKLKNDFGLAILSAGNEGKRSKAILQSFLSYNRNPDYTVSPELTPLRSELDSYNEAFDKFVKGEFEIGHQCNP